jgi:uncharacterized protein
VTTHLSLTDEALRLAMQLSDFNSSVDGVQHTILVGDDGLLIAVAGASDRAYADRLAAVVSGLRSLAEGGAQVLGEGLGDDLGDGLGDGLGNGGVRQVIVEFHHGYLFVARVTGGFDLGVSVAADCDLGAVGYEVALVVDRLGAALTLDIASDLKNSLPK